MLKDMTERKYIYWTEHEVRFWFDNTGGYGFPCDSKGNVLTDKMTPQAVENYQWCMAHPEKFKTYNRRVTIERRAVEPATGVCQCGNRVELVNQYLGACECPHCGRWYNLFGQELNHPSTWPDGDDW